MLQTTVREEACRYAPITQDECVSDHEDLPFDDAPTPYNNKLFNYQLWCNTERSRESPKQLSSLNRLVNITRSAKDAGLMQPLDMPLQIGII